MCIRDRKKRPKRAAAYKGQSTSAGARKGKASVGFVTATEAPVVVFREQQSHVGRAREAAGVPSWSREDGDQPDEELLTQDEVDEMEAAEINESLGDINARVIPAPRRVSTADSTALAVRSLRTASLLASSVHIKKHSYGCLLYTSPSPRDLSTSRMPSSA